MGATKRESSGDDEEEPPAKRQQVEDREEVQPGLLKSIYVENFMCHRKLRVDFNKNIVS